MNVCRWCLATEGDVDFLGRLCDDNPKGDEHEMVAECFECDKPATSGNLCTRHYVQNKS